MMMFAVILASSVIGSVAFVTAADEIVESVAAVIPVNRSSP